MSRDLPAFMIPGVIRRVDEMPLTKNGKIDRKSLLKLQGAEENERNFKAEQNCILCFDVKLSKTE